MSKNFTATRTIPQRKPQKRIRGFLGLPGELRNRVYHYYFQDGFRVEIASNGADFQYSDRSRPTVKLSLNLGNVRDRNDKNKETNPADKCTVMRMSRELGKYKRVEGVRTKWPTSLTALIYVCKQVHIETLDFLYCYTIFAFEAPNRIINFLHVVPRPNISVITKLHLQYSTYGDPIKLDDRQWQLKHMNRWNHACRAASKNLRGLRELKVRLFFNGSDVYMHLRHAYLEPLWHFRRLTHKPTTADEEQQSARPLQIVDVQYSSRWSRPEAFDPRVREVAAASRDLHKEYGHAISRAILGWSEEDAMMDLKEAWKRHDTWRHHLNFLETGW